jgi:aminopeptidase N
MEEVSGIDLSVFFNQWLYDSGALKLEGFWSYDSKAGQVILNINQVQKEGALFVMPIEVQFDLEGNKKQIERIHLEGKSNVFKIKVDKEPKNVQLDPNLWVLMQTNFEKRTS